MLKVNFYATLRAIVGQKTVEVDAHPGATAREVVALIVEKYPKLRVELLDEHNELFSHQKFFINGREAIYLEKKMDTPIVAEDRVDLFPPVGGG